MVIRCLTLFAFVILFPGCAATYDYQRTSESDPTLVFGDRFGGEAYDDPVRTFMVEASGEKKCGDFVNVGVFSDKDFGSSVKSTTLPAPPGKEIMVKGLLATKVEGEYQRCVQGPVFFETEKNRKYSIDMKIEDGQCRLYVAELKAEAYDDGAVKLTQVPSCQ